MGFPPSDKSLEGVLKDTRERLDLVERRLIMRDQAPVPPPIWRGTTAPTSIPPQVGAIYIRTDTSKVYFAVGTTSSADWVLLN